LGGFFLPLMIVLLVLAALLREDFIFSILYLFAGSYALGRWWSRRAMAAVRVERLISARAFLEEEVPVRLELTNTSWLPVPWLRLHEALPIDLISPNFFRRVVSLGPYEKMRFEYTLRARKRGYYPIGPATIYSGDLLGLADQLKWEGRQDFLTVFPRIVPLAKVRLPSRSPMGTLRHTQPVFEDPTRVLGKRDYIPGDSLRRVDWKASAASGRLQVKLFEPSIALETTIFLNLNYNEYDQRQRYVATEQAVVAAASLANWIAGQKQSVGLATNGFDPLGVDCQAQALPPRKGQGHLLRLLEILARIQAAEAEPLVELLRRHSPLLPWGTTLILISGQASEALFDQLFQVRRAGLNALLVLCGPVGGFRQVKARADHFGFPLVHLLNERDFDVWR
jgi:uncharacterized protein (DUF58 family)